MIGTGTLAWFDLNKKFGFVTVGGREVFLHTSVLKAAGYVWIPRGTTLQLRLEDGIGKPKVVEVLAVDTSTARPGQSVAGLRKREPKTCANIPDRHAHASLRIIPH